MPNKFYKHQKLKSIIEYLKNPNIPTRHHTLNDTLMTEKEIRQLQDLRTELSSTKNKIASLQQQIKQMEEIIYSQCQHNWIIDRTNVGEHTEHMCTKCQLSERYNPQGVRLPTTH